MKKITAYLSLVALILTVAATNVFAAADAKVYQVTGPVLEVHDTYLVVQKGDDKWQVECPKAEQNGVKVGDKVTIKYQMIAQAVVKK